MEMVSRVKINVKKRKVYYFYIFKGLFFVYKRRIKILVVNDRVGINEWNNILFIE